MKEQENGTIYDKFDSVAVRQNETMTHENWKKAHEEEEKQQLKEAWQVLDENKIDWDGKVFHNASLQARKMDRRTFLKVLAALSILAVAVKFGVDILQPELSFRNAKSAAKDIVSDLVEQKKYFGENSSLPAQIDANNRRGFENLIMDIMNYSQYADGSRLSFDQAIFTINCCGITENLYETYYGKSYENYISNFSTYVDVAKQSYENYIQTGKTIPIPRKNVSVSSRGINYAEGIGNIEEQINSVELNVSEESSKAL